MMKKLLVLFLFSCATYAQIYAPEGVNIPGAWNGWTNPPATLALAGPQTSGGKFTVNTTGTRRYETTIKVAASGGDVTGGTYDFKFTSGNSSAYWFNQWSGTTVTMNTIQSYTYYQDANPSPNSITVTNGKWYTVRFKDIGYASTTAIFMETSGDPVSITDVTYSTPQSGVALTVNITTSATPSTEEKIYVRYSMDGWSTSKTVQATGSGTSWSGVIPGADIDGTPNNNGFYVLTSTFSTITHDDADMQTIKFNNNGGSNYSLPVELVALSAKVTEQGVLLTWETATELNNAGFDIEKSLDKTNWIKIGNVAGYGNSNSPRNYSFTDKVSQSGTLYYRLKQNDNSGEFEYSKVIEAIVEAPGKFNLAQNYPNPFNPVTNISYSIAKPAQVVITLYNALGQQVRVLENTPRDAGYYSISVNAANLGSGVYYYKLEAGSYSQMKKMIVLK